MKHKMKVLVTAELDRPRIETLASDFEFEYAGYSIDRVVMSRESLKAAVADKDVLICEYDTVDDEIFSAATELKLIVCCRGGVGSVVDLASARRHGVAVCNTAGRNANAVADFILGYILDLTRNITLTNNLIHSKVLAGGESTKPSEYRDVVWGLGNESPFVRYRGRSINRITLGVIGFGHAGRALAKKCALLGMKVIVYSPHANRDNVPDYVVPVSLEELIAVSDVVSVNCALNDKTVNMFDASLFAAMKRDAYFINTSRGEIVVEEDLAYALKTGQIAGAAIDVTREEPLTANSPLIGIPNLILTPHLGGSSDDVRMQGSEMVVKILVSWRDGRRLVNCVQERIEA